MMNKMNPEIDNYLAVGCGRCPLVGTPACKVHNWQAEMRELRKIILDSGLTEELKWRIPCYTFENSNILIMSAFKEYCSLSFFKGVLLKDTHNILEQPGKNTQAGRHIPFTDVQSIVELELVLKAYIQEAIEVEKAGLKVALKETRDYDFPEELQEALAEDPAFQAAFEALTPGRQRGYLLHFSGAKQSKTRLSRIEKCMPAIFEGKGLYDR
jgi:uncharacterized protein YdeI (YjbR/CyaY-like superfamily)